MSTPTDLSAGTWNIDPVHSTVAFIVRHLGVSNLRGNFRTFEGSLDIGENPLESKVSVSIDTSSVDTGDANRDGHLRGTDFFDVEQHKQIVFNSTSVEADGDAYKVNGDLTVNGVTKPVTLQLTFNGTSPDPWGGTRAGFGATTSVSRNDFGVTFDIPVLGSAAGFVVGDWVGIELDVQAVKA